MKTERPVVGVVNDDAAFAQALDTLLRDEGYDTLLFQSGGITNESIKQQPPRAVILDISIDNPNPSWKIVDLLVLDPETAKIPVIICSVADQTLRERSPKLQAAGYSIIEKPFAIDELLGRIRTYLGKP